MPRSDNAVSEPVAVIGAGCRLPGGLNSPAELWRALLGARDLVTEVPPARWDADAFYDPEPGVPGRTQSRWGGFLDDVAGFDFGFFGIGRAEAERLTRSSGSCSRSPGRRSSMPGWRRAR